MTEVHNQEIKNDKKGYNIVNDVINDIVSNKKGRSIVKDSFPLKPDGLLVVPSPNSFYFMYFSSNGSGDTDTQLCPAAPTARARCVPPPGDSRYSALIHRGRHYRSDRRQERRVAVWGEPQHQQVSITFTEGDTIALVGGRREGWQYGENLNTNK